jgi:capsid protein
MESEDLVLNATKRRNVQSTARDIQRNFALAAWMIRKHLDFVSSFSFQSKTGDEALDDDVESFIDEWSKRNNCDAARRHRLDRFVRLLEARRVLDGDVFVVKLSTGHLQAIEADRVRNPRGRMTSSGDADLDRQTVEAFGSFVHGIEPNQFGAARRYAIWRRDNKQYSFDRFLSARFVSPYGFFDRFDQVRGVSPLTASLNSLQDVYENVSFALAKAKVGQIFALSLFRDADDNPGSDPTVDSTGDGEPDTEYKFNATDGPQMLNLDAGDRAEFLESKQPSGEFRDFMVSVSQIALKALDIPYSFLDESHTNFYGSKGAINGYLKSTKSKRQDCQELLNDLTRWRLGIEVAQGRLRLPGSMTFDDLRFEWTPDGLPWLNPLQEVNGARAAIESALDNPQRICKANGTNFRDNVDAIAEAKAYAESQGVELSFDQFPEQPQFTIED